MYKETYGLNWWGRIEAGEKENEFLDRTKSVKDFKDHVVGLSLKLTNAKKNQRDQTNEFKKKLDEQQNEFEGKIMHAGEN